MPSASSSGSYEAASASTASASDSYAATAAGSAANASGSYSAVSNTAPNAGVDQVAEPYDRVTLTGVDAEGPVAWSQVGGPAVTLGGAGSVRTFVAPATRAGTVLTFRATDTGGLVDDMQVTVYPHNEWAVIGGTEVPYRTAAVAA